jgi:UDP-glucose 4-epimerase
MKKACVIGGSGFLGSHVADALSDKGYQVAVFDQNVSPWLRADQEMIVGDLMDQANIFDAISGSEVVYNFAGLSDINEALSKPMETARLNILGNLHVLDACRLHKVKRFMYASSVYVYSREGGFYRCSKQAAEHYIEEYQRAFGVDYTILRYGSLYGPRSDERNGLYRIVSAALESGILHYEGSRETLREYIHVEDAAKASVAALGNDFCNESIVLTGQEPMRVMDLLEMLAEILGLTEAVNFTAGIQTGHYIRTPYAYQPKLGRKYVLPMHIDLGQGLMQLIEAIQEAPNK